MGSATSLTAEQRVACQYFEDRSIADACPPLLALLSIMAKGSFEDKDVHHPEVRKMFTHDYLCNSDWYRERLVAKQKSDVKLWQRHFRYVDECLANQSHMWADNYTELLHRVILQRLNSNVQVLQRIWRC